VNVSSEVDGRVGKIYFSSGDKFGNNMPIIQLDDSQAQADYDAAVTALKLSRSKLNRAKLLLNEAISQQEYEQLKADVDSKESDLKIAQATLNQKQIKAPFAGVLGAFQVQQGDYIKPGDPLVTLVNTEELEADYNIPEQYLPQLKTGQLIRLVVSAYPNKTFYGTVNFISPTVSDTTRMVALHATVDNKHNLLSPGMFIQVTQKIDEKQNVIAVPESAVLADVKGYYVFKVIKNQAAQTYITIGDRVGGIVEVKKGLQVGDSVVTAGQQKLQDGSRIEIKSNQ
jgi:membrane fusion protein (multidrug efflux system)